ncbi:MAG TPA: toll/interleukin-1 receptor domain-containing protein, partial [Bacteroidia bacterium]|nr:toll/interleukin-1 receptor domain-containing protein [Bacteroidia bacterium]
MKKVTGKVADKHISKKELLKFSKLICYFVANMSHKRIQNPTYTVWLISGILLFFSETGCVGTVYTDRGGPLFGIVLALLILFGSIALAFGIKSTFQHKESETEVTNGKEVANVFISYSTSDKLIADRIAVILERAGIKVLLDSHDIQSGENIEDFIRRSIQASTRTLLIVSNNSFSSPWVGFETVYAIHF